MLESLLHHRFRSVGCLGVCASVTFCLPRLGIVKCASHSYALVAWRPTLVVQYPLAPISFRLLGNYSISGTLDTNPRQLAQKRILPHCFIQFRCRFYSHLIQKRALSHPFLFLPSFPNFALTAKVEAFLFPLLQFACKPSYWLRRDYETLARFLYWRFSGFIGWGSFIVLHRSGWRGDACRNTANI